MTAAPHLDRAASWKNHHLRRAGEGRVGNYISPEEILHFSKPLLPSATSQLSCTFLGLVSLQGNQRGQGDGMAARGHQRGA